MLKESAKPVPMGKKRRKVAALKAPGEPIVIPPRPRPAQASGAPEEEKKEEESKQSFKSKRNKTPSN